MEEERESLENKLKKKEEEVQYLRRGLCEERGRVYTRLKDCGIGLDIWRTRKREGVKQRRESWKRERKKKR